MKKVLFVNPGHFGSITDTYFYCQNLKDLFEVSYFGVFEEKNSIDSTGINIVHLNLPYNPILKKILFIWKLYKLTKKTKYDFIFINYFLGSSIIAFFSKTKTNIDIRTSTISKNKLSTLILNFILSIEVRFFSKISCISSSLSIYLNLPQHTHILPLGAPELPLINKDFSIMKILYVGTFKERSIVNTVHAFSKFISNYDNKKIATYSIIGFGSDEETRSIQEAITLEGMQENIFFKGKVRYPELFTYLNEHNVGLSYIPIRKCFENQPPTKTFEYLLSGMIVLATGTKENTKVINEKNGFIIGDSVDSLTEGFKIIYEKRHLFSSTDIQNCSKMYSWEFIVKNNLYEYINKG